MARLLSPDASFYTGFYSFSSIPTHILLLSIFTHTHTDTHVDSLSYLPHVWQVSGPGGAFTASKPLTSDLWLSFLLQPWGTCSGHTNLYKTEWNLLCSCETQTNGLCATDFYSEIVFMTVLFVKALMKKLGIIKQYHNCKMLNMPWSKCGNSQSHSFNHSVCGTEQLCGDESVFIIVFFLIW